MVVSPAPVALAQALVPGVGAVDDTTFAAATVLLENLRSFLGDGLDAGGGLASLDVAANVAPTMSQKAAFARTDAAGTLRSWYWVLSHLVRLPGVGSVYRRASKANKYAPTRTHIYTYKKTQVVHVTPTKQGHSFLEMYVKFFTQAMTQTLNNMNCKRGIGYRHTTALANVIATRANPPTRREPSFRQLSCRSTDELQRSKIKGKHLIWGVLASYAFNGLSLHSP